MWWIPIGLWILIILIALGIPLRIHYISKGIHEETQYPVTNAIMIIVNMILIWFLFSVLSLV